MTADRCQTKSSDESSQVILDVVAEGIADPTLSELKKSLPDLARDVLLDESTLSTIPVVGPIMTAAKSGLMHISGTIFANKILRFLVNLEGMSPKARKRFKESIGSDPKYRRRVGTEILVLLDRFESFEKVDWLAKAFLAYLDKEIDFEKFSRLGSSLDKTNVYDVKELLSGDPSDGLLRTLLQTGLSVFDVGRGTSVKNPRVNYHLSSLGETLKSILSSR